MTTRTTWSELKTYRWRQVKIYQWGYTLQLPDREQALYRFWAGFGIPAYEENSVPADAAYPYITYSVSVGDRVSLTANIFYRSSSLLEINSKTAEIESTLGRSGITARYNNGALWIQKGSPFYVTVPAEESDIKHKLLNIEAEFIERGKNND